MSKARIAIIEDALDIQEIYKTALEADGFDVTIASNGEDGKALIEAQKPDVVLLDVMMPGMDGNEMLQQLQTDPKFKSAVLVLTNMNKDDGAKLFENLKIADYIVKSEMNPSEIISRVNDVLNGNGRLA